MLGPRFRARASSSCGKRGPLFTAVCGPLTTAASRVAEHRLQTRRLSSCGPQAQLLRGMWDPPRPGPEPASPAPAGRLPTTAPPGKPHSFFNILLFLNFWLCQVFVAVRGLSLVVVSGGYSSLRCVGFSLWWLLLLWSTGSRRMGFSSCGARAQ